jgi:hypothetical protein
MVSRMEPANILRGEREAVLRLVRPFQIHGAGFCEIGVSFPDDPPDTMRRLRVADNVLYPDPRPGDRVRIAFLMGNVTRVEKLG